LTHSQFGGGEKVNYMEAADKNSQVPGELKQVVKEAADFCPSEAIVIQEQMDSEEKCVW
jgi:ferredoxin